MEHVRIGLACVAFNVVYTMVSPVIIPLVPQQFSTLLSFHSDNMAPSLVHAFILGAGGSFGLQVFDRTINRNIFGGLI